jgi:hypothetical protein
VRELEETTGKKVDILDEYQIDKIRAQRPYFIKSYDRDRKLIFSLGCTNTAYH